MTVLSLKVLLTYAYKYLHIEISICIYVCELHMIKSSFLSAILSFYSHGLCVVGHGDCELEFSHVWNSARFLVVDFKHRQKKGLQSNGGHDVGQRTNRFITV